jgi:tripartite-type tricarboxylate transporter receptor subunit TctC
LAQGKIRPLAIATTKRIEWAKDIPTFMEQGVDLVLYSQEGYFAPKGTPQDVLQILETAIEKTAKDSAFIEQVEKNLINVLFLNRSEYGKFVAKEDIRIKSIVQEVGLAKPAGK